MSTEMGFDASTTDISDHLPGPHLTRSWRAFFLCRSPRTAVNGRSAQWFETAPRRAIPEGHTTSITRTAPQSADPPSLIRATSRVRVHKLRSHYRSLSATTGRSAGARRDGTQHLAVSAAWCAPSRPRNAAGAVSSARLPVFPHASRRPGSRHLHAGHRLASRRVSARLIPGRALSPRFRCRFILSTLQRWFTRVRLPGPRLTALTPPFPHRSPRQSSASAACGGLTPPPAGRRRRATKPSSCVQQAHRVIASYSGDSFPRTRRKMPGALEGKWRGGSPSLDYGG